MDAHPEQGKPEGEAPPQGEGARTAWYWACVLLFVFVAVAMLAMLLKPLF